MTPEKHITQTIVRRCGVGAALAARLWKKLEPGEQERLAAAAARATVKAAEEIRQLVGTAHERLHAKKKRTAKSKRTAKTTTKD